MRLTTRHEPFAWDIDLPVKMVRDDLEAIPEYELPDGYAIRWYQPGDGEHWLRIHQECEGYGSLSANLFDEQFGTDPKVLRERIAFVCREDGIPVSTNAAWMGDWNGVHWGRVHWVATSQDEQGKGLSKPIMTLICERLKSLGHDKAYLTTNTSRVRAIALYTVFGFQAYWETEKEERIWRVLGEKMKDIGHGIPGL